MEKKEDSNNGGITIVSLLGIVFIALKLIGVIDWSWFWVTIPFWGGLGMLLIFLFIGMIWAFIGSNKK